MTPIKFPEATNTLFAPIDWDEKERGPCGALPVFRQHDQYISCWRPSWRERLVILFGGPVWLTVLSRGHPAVALRAVKRVFTPGQVALATAEQSAWRADNKVG